MKGDVFDLRRLRYFSAIAEAGSLSAAARGLNVAQPALSHQLGELERCLGMPVFRRLPKGVELTLAGLVLLEHARKILSDIEAADGALQKLKTTRSTPPSIRPSLTPSIYDIAPALLARFGSEFPDTRLILTEDRHRYCQELINSEKRDLAITLVDPAWSGGQSICWEEMHLVKLPTGENSPDGTVRFQHLSREPRLIVPGIGGPLRKMIDAIASSTDTTLHIVQELQGASARKHAVLKGLGSAIIPWRNVAREVADGALMSWRIVDPQLRRELVMRSTKSINPDLALRCAQLLQRILAA